MSNNNVYVYGDVLVEKEFDNVEPDYIYINPMVYEFRNGYAVIINEEGSQLEFVDKSSGFLVSIGITHDTDLIVHIENALEGMLNGNEESRVIETIKIKKELSFRELMEYIIQNEVSGEFASIDGNKRFWVGIDKMFKFYEHDYDIGETYRMEVEEQITEDTEFDGLVEVFDETSITYHHYSSIRDVKDSRSGKIYALIDGELQLVWDRDTYE